MNKKEIEEYLKRIDELGAKLTGKDKETYAWLIYGFNQCAKLLNEAEQQCKKQKEGIDKAIEYIKEKYDYILGDDTFLDHDEIIDRKQIIHILELLGDKEVSE